MALVAEWHVYTYLISNLTNQLTITTFVSSIECQETPPVGKLLISALSTAGLPWLLKCMAVYNWQNAHTYICK